jgi:hypothetical protein
MVALTILIWGLPFPTLYVSFQNSRSSRCQPLCHDRCRCRYHNYHRRWSLCRNKGQYVFYHLYIQYYINQLKRSEQRNFKLCFILVPVIYVIFFRTVNYFDDFPANYYDFEPIHHERVPCTHDIYLGDDIYSLVSRSWSYVRLLRRDTR